MIRSARLPLAALVLLPLLAGADWPEFRGTAGVATSNDTGLPDHWDNSTNLLWKLKLPGEGASSPIVFGDRVYVTCFTGQPGKLVRQLVCANRKDGTPVWTKEIHSTTPEANYNGMMTQHGYASNTPATDGKRIYVFLGTAGVYAFDLEGKEVWKHNVGQGTDQWGSGSSVRLFGDLVIVDAAIESSKVIALDKNTGHEKWSFSVARRSWSTPAVVRSEGREELVVSFEGRVSALDQAGKEIWHCEGLVGYTCPSVIPAEGMVFVCGGGPSNMTQIAIRTGGSGDVTKSHVVWRQRGGANVPTPVSYKGHLFGVSDRGGIAFCINAETGKSDYQQRLQAGLEPTLHPVAYQPPGGRGRRGMGPGGGGGLSFYASAVAADDKIFIPSRTSGIFVLAANSEFKLLSCNHFEGDASRFDGTPAISDGQIFLRSNEYLYCVGKKE
ncbi:MAG: outer membrane protein assembly factor BamB family protein [Planctomycetaceae bacterium]